MQNDELFINGERLWSSLMEMAEVGATSKGGCNRQALTDEDKVGRDMFVGWCTDAGCTVRVDAMGNLFARRTGRDESLPPVIVGSHLDTQPTGGKFDGVYGVLAGLEVVRTLNDAELATDRALEVVVWTNEEGARFSPAMIGSGVWAGEFSLEYGHGRTDKNGISIGEELERLGYLDEVSIDEKNVAAAFELHIEQGPILEHEGLTIGVLTGVQGMNWYDLTLEGSACHAGPTPMGDRRDPMMGLHSILKRYYELAIENGPWGRITFGDIRLDPGSRNTVPEKIVLSIDMRHPEQAVLDEMDRRLHFIAAEEADRFGLGYSIHDEWQSPAVEFDGDCIAAVQRAADLLGYSNKKMVSGAGHDSVYVSRVAPTGMIFVPCEGGLSHNEAENANPEELEAGCNVLLHAMLERANQH